MHYDVHYAIQYIFLLFWTNCGVTYEFEIFHLLFFVPCFLTQLWIFNLYFSLSLWRTSPNIFCKADLHLMAFSNVFVSLLVLGGGFLR